MKCKARRSNKYWRTEVGVRLIMIVISMSLGGPRRAYNYIGRRDEETLLGALKKEHPLREAVFVLAIHIQAAAAHARIICKAPWELFKHKRCAVT